MTRARSLLSRVEQLEESQALPDPDLLRRLTAPIHAAIRQKMDDLKSEHPEQFEPGGPCTLPRTVGWGAAHRFCRDLTDGEARDYLAWCERHGEQPARVTLTDEERADNDRCELKGIERLMHSPTWRRTAVGTGESAAEILQRIRSQSRS